MPEPPSRPRCLPRRRVRALFRPHDDDGAGTLAFLIGFALAYVFGAL